MLNHLVDTSFAGSAMRTTEGCWMSLTPTTDMLIVSLDFEGVHSIERSAQEDMLLVLFNTAISNLVCYRFVLCLAMRDDSLVRSSSVTTLHFLAILWECFRASSPRLRSWIRQQIRNYFNLNWRLLSRYTIVQPQSH